MAETGRCSWVAGRKGDLLFCFSCAPVRINFHRREIGMGLGSERAGDSSEAGARRLRGQQERGSQAVILGQRVVPPLRDGLERFQAGAVDSQRAKGKWGK